MQTLTFPPQPSQSSSQASQSSSQPPLEFRETHSTQYVIYRNDRNLGAIAFNITAMRWEYRPYGQAVKAVGTLEQCKDAATQDLQAHPSHYAHATPDNLPPRLYIVKQPLGYRAYFNPLTPGPGNTARPTFYSPYLPTADFALKAHLSEYIEDLIQYEAFQVLLSLSQRFDGQAVIDAFERLKQINPDKDYYLDAAAGRVPPISAL